MSDRPIAIVVLAAGAGTRMRSARPKVLHEIAGRPLLAHVLATASELAPQHTVVVVRHERDQVVAAIESTIPGLIVVDQDEVPGTGRAVELAISALPDGFDGDVVVLSADVPLLVPANIRILLTQHRGDGAAATILSARVTDPTGYGRIIRNASGAVDRIVEEVDATDDERAIEEINSGTYVFDAAHLRAALAEVGTANAQAEKYLTDVIGGLRSRGFTISAHVAPDALTVLGVNDRSQLAEAERIMNARIVRRHQLAGVTIRDPQTTWIDVDVTIGADSEILPGTQLRGATTIGSGVTIGPDSTIRDCEIGDGATVSRTDATLAVIEAGATVGPFAYLRPGTILGPKGKIGTFVETKNTRIGAGSKVPHLSYVGDTEIGEGSNLGASTITANYDGVNKHRTVVGDHVRTGSHNVFVAPVRIGDGAYTGAGTVVRKDVPPGSLALLAASQRNVEGWVARSRPGTAAAEAAERAKVRDEEQDD